MKTYTPPELLFPSIVETCKNVRKIGIVAIVIGVIILSLVIGYLAFTPQSHDHTQTTWSENYGANERIAKIVIPEEHMVCYVSNTLITSEMSCFKDGEE